MKKILYTLLLSCLLISSCDVEVTNPNDLEVKIFWKTEADAQSGLNAVYNMFYKPGLYTRWIWFRYDLASDEAFSSSPWLELADWTRFNYANYNFWEGNAWTYRDSYEAIYRANQVLHYTPDITFGNETEKTYVLGQAYFLRALHYYNLALLWGSENNSLAIVLEPSSPGDTPEGHNVTEVWQQVKDDLASAINMLPASWDDTNKGRATIGAAKALRAKCLMQQHEWEAAKQELEWLVTGEGSQYYGLANNFKDNFTHLAENNIESVFELQYSDAHKAPAGDGDFDIDPNLGQNRAQFFGPPGIGWTDGEARSWLVDEFKSELNNDGEYDIRLKTSLFYEGMDVDFADNDRMYSRDMGAWQQDNYIGRVFIRKYASDYYRDYEDYHNPINIRLIRYADVMLMYAECLANTTSGSLNEAVDLVNEIRARVNMPELAVNHPEAVADKTAFLKRLQIERSLELCHEGQRWADLKRWGLFDTSAGLNELKQRDSDFNNFVIGRHSSLPIPSNEIDNNAGLQQNPNY
ncbi:RagB/SusD family nutrient uptake outer membrane protein [Plebeiibacterium sediminum]|uniref:RagB/SusD family nutrient uptake outer membrane protein n=1 Tax=Plebeiibacterium sediminum TaxID=2992112 RepID=A0AAE3M6R8_9BACT|nr:RagB/SusD family nutrient uptake outer membrane protein [Plebeiobacterium sediminum]MCW3788031.1 RagB/SusD family nutrient uptake outer membrane protein [Plebeiobacterium sediminum]